MPRHARRWQGFNEAIVPLYSRLTTGDIRAHLGEIYGVEVSRDLISRVTDGSPRSCTAGQAGTANDLERVRIGRIMTPRTRSTST
jgi:hypothetical protein